MSLQSIQVHVDWEERAKQALAREEEIGRGILATAALAVFLALLAKNVLPGSNGSRLLVEGVVSVLYLGVSAWVLVQPSGNKRQSIGLYILAVFGLLVNVGIALRFISGVEYPLEYYALVAIASLALVVPGWSILKQVVSIHPQEIYPSGSGAGRWLARILVGVVAGGGVVLLLLLAQFFGDMRARPSRLDPTFVQYVSIVLGLRAPGEELFLRGVVFGLLYRRQGRDFISAVLVTAVLALGLQVAQLPADIALPGVVLWLLGSFLMTVLNSALYAWKEDLAAPIVANVIFRILGFIFLGG